MNNDKFNCDEAVFVDENRNIIRGEQAIELIRARQPEFIDPEKGIIKVDEDRWREAQRYERKTWMEGIAPMSDRNEEHESCYGGYQSIKGKHFANAIELGCGPFTNMRKILQVCTIDEIDLLDPLANDYLNHPFCRYKLNRLGGILKTTLIPWSKRGGFKHPLRFYQHKLDEWKIGTWHGRPVNLHSIGIEDFDPPKRYDLCVMINVIEHCRDVEAIFSRILQMTKPGSFLFFADKIYDAKSEAEIAKSRFDAGHPIRVDYSVLKNFLMLNFDPVWNNEVLLQGGTSLYRCEYFAGIRKSND